MSKHKFYRKVIRFEILSEEPFDDPLDLSDIDAMTDDGYCSGMFLEDEICEEIDGPTCAKKLIAQGSDPEFFRLDKDGNDLDDE